MLASLSLKVERANECSDSLQIIKHHSNIPYYYCDGLGGRAWREASGIVLFPPKSQTIECSNFVRLHLSAVWLSSGFLITDTLLLNELPRRTSSIASHMIPRNAFQHLLLAELAGLMLLWIKFLQVPNTALSFTSSGYNSGSPKGQKTRAFWTIYWHWQGLYIFD